MKGVVDDSGRAILPIKILCPKYPTGVQVDAWIDTGFTGDFVLPQIVIEDLQLEITGSIDGVLADGSGIELSTYHCELEWFGKLRALEVIANLGQTPLLGVGLLSFLHYLAITPTPPPSSPLPLSQNHSQLGIDLILMRFDDVIEG